jgi:hypothetical protein
MRYDIVIMTASVVDAERCYKYYEEMKGMNAAPSVEA